MDLRPTHHGYAYQDLVAGNAFVDLLFGTASSVKVDLKEFGGDRFDDITIVRLGGRRIRLQVKHTSLDRELSRATFTADGRHLRLDRVIESLITDLDSNADTTYRILVRDGAPDVELARVLLPIDPSFVSGLPDEPSEEGGRRRSAGTGSALVEPAVPADPGDPLPGIATTRYKFDPARLSQLAPWATLLAGFTGSEVARACDRLIVDTTAPAATLSFRDPGAVESALLRRAVDLGAGRPPNANRSPEEVALSLTHAATRARAVNGTVTRTDIAAEVGLTTDFGAVREGQPVEVAVEVPREGAATILRTEVDRVAPAGGRVVLVGEPGAGKSWLSEQITRTYRDDGWIVARHHCWLGETDTDRSQRVLLEVVIGSLLNQIEVQAPDAVAGIRPRFAATTDALSTALRDCRASHPTKPVLLVVDGLDHIDRVSGRHLGNRRTTDPARTVVDELATIHLPANVCLVFASQPGPHLDNASPASGRALEMPRMSYSELTALAERHHALTDPRTTEPASDRERHNIVGLLEARSNGNALYATYLCKQATGVSPTGDPKARPLTVAELTDRLRQVPSSATDVDAYYQHLLSSLTDGEQHAVGALAICDFALTRDELSEVLPLIELLLDRALATLAPVLVSVPGAGGLKVHHESLSRFVRRDKPGPWADHIRLSAANWLKQRGFFRDTRAFRNLPTLLADLGAYDELAATVDVDFVANAIGQLQPPGAIKHVLATVAAQAETRLDWRTLLVCVEAQRAVGVYELESLPDTLVSFADVVVRLLGADTVAERLSYEGRATFPARWGLNLCEAVDRAGVPAPWDTYLTARQREAETDNTHYGEDSDARLHSSQQLGHLRQRQSSSRPIDASDLTTYFDEYDGAPHLSDTVDLFATVIPAGDLFDAAQAMTDPSRATDVFIALADLAGDGAPGLPGRTDLAREAAIRTPGRYVTAYLDHGVPAAELLAGLGIEDLLVELRAATAALLVDKMVERPGHVRLWLDLLRLTHATDPAMPMRINSDISGDGFYRAWLRFAVDTVGLFEDVRGGIITSEAASTTVRVALNQLATQAGVRTRHPRTIDLWSIHSLIHEVIEGALLVVVPADLDDVLSHLTTIGDQTTGSPLGMAETGPLATNDLLGILSRVADHIGTSPIHQLMPTIRRDRYDANTMYSVTADFETATARICLDAGDHAEADRCWQRASKLLCAYGGHKDSTIFEFIEAADDLADVNLNQARAALARVQDPAYLAAQHTDGRGTNHARSSWWRHAADLDPTAAANDSADTLIREYGFEDYLAHVTHTQLLTTHLATADPIALAALRLTVGPDWREPTTDLTLATRLATEIGTSPRSDAALATFANHLAASYNNQALMYTQETPTSAAPPELVIAIQELGGPAFADSPAAPTSTNDVTKNAPRAPARAGALRDTIDASLRPHLEPGPPGAALAARDYETHSYRTERDTIRYDLDALANAVGWRILEATASTGVEAGKNVLDSVARELRFMSAEELFANLADGLATRCDGSIADLEQVAAYAYTLAYTRIRGGGGWQTFAGRERVDLWTNARRLHPDTADRTFAAAIAHNIATEQQGLYGITQATIAAFAADPPQGTGGTAYEAWTAAFDILEERLPGAAQRTGLPYTPTPTPDDPDNLNDALATLAVAVICQPKTADIRAALLALTLLISCRPRLAQTAATALLTANLDAGRVTWILETLRDHLPHGHLGTPLTDELTRLAGTDLLSVRTLAGEVLAHHDKPVPNRPTTTPDGAIRLAISRALDET